MKRSSIFLLAFFVFLFCAWLGLVVTYGQETEEPGAEEGELRPPDFVNADYGFGLALPEGYITFPDEDNGVWTLKRIGELDQPTAIVSAEKLPDDVTDVAGFWQFVKDRDPLVANNITYEKVGSIADTGAVQVRIERIENGKYILAITWVFVHDGNGFIVSGYPPEGGDNNTARDIALEVAQQWRWMTDEEIQAFQSQEEENPPPQGKEF